jgi:hypothetical protein
MVEFPDVPGETSVVAAAEIVNVPDEVVDPVTVTLAVPVAGA